MSASKVSSVLVTGGAGFIGSHLCERLLAEGKRVVAVDDLSAGHLSNLTEARGYGSKFTFYNVEIRAEGLPRIFQRHTPDVAVHLAARREDPSTLDPVAEAGVGMMGLLNVLEASVSSGVRKVVFASGAGVYGDSRRLPLRETVAPASRPLTPLAMSKKHAEDFLRLYQRTRGLDFAALALGCVYGPRQYPADGSGVVGSLAGAMLDPDGSPPTILGDGNQTRDFVFIDDAVHAFSLALAPGRAAGRLINIGTGLETSVNGLFRMLADITGYRGEPAFGPVRPFDVRRSGLDHTLAEQELDWRPWTHLEDGLRETVAFLKGP